MQQEEMDDRIEALQTKCIAWTLILWHKITEICAFLYKKGKKTCHGICDAQKDVQYVFLDPNGAPYCVRGDLNVDLYSGSLTFNQETGQFVSCGRLQPRHKQRFDAVQVICERGREDNVDLTGFFHTVSWFQGSAPSLVEILVLYGILYEKRPYRLSELSEWHLNVLDSDAEEHRIPLSSLLARSRFQGWALRQT